MKSIVKAGLKDAGIVAHIGRVSVEEAHRDSCSVKDMNEFLIATYNEEAVTSELANSANLYHLINFNGQTAGFSKIIFNATHPNIERKNITKLDRIYLLKEFYHQHLGFELLKYNIDLAKNNHQSGIWLFTWVGNTRAVNFYLRNGFNIIGSHKFKVTETHYNDHYQMFLDLSHS